MEDNNYYEYQLEQEVDNFNPQTVIDYVMGTVVVLAIIVCIGLNAIHVWGMVYESIVERRLRKAIQKEKEQTQKINRP